MDAQQPVDAGVGIMRALEGAGFRSPQYICCIWHGTDRLAVLSAGVPPQFLIAGLEQALESLKETQREG